MTKKLGPRYIWFKLSLVMGSLLGLLLLGQSLFNYFHVSRLLVAEQLQREAQRQVASLQREARRLDIREPAELAGLFEEIRQDAPKKIAWIRLTDMAGHTLVQSGEVVGPPIAPERLRSAFEQREPIADVRETPSGKVRITVLPLRLARRQLSEISRQEPGPGPGPRLGPRLVEIALYVDSASTTFGRLRRNLIVSSSAALGLVASMVLLWFRFPHYVRGKQLEQQLELARRVQNDLLPSVAPSFENLDFAAECVAAWQVGGDFYDIFSADRGRIALVLGDVSGKGLPAALLMALLHGAVRSSSWLAGSTEHEASSGRLNELLRTRTSQERFASLFWCYYEPDTKILRYVNAGHEPPIMVRRNGNGEFEIQRLKEGGPVLGLVSVAGYRQGKVAIGVGDLLVLYSDGIIEAMNASEEEFGEERLVAAIRENWSRSSAEIRDEILKRVHRFVKEEELQDDLTLVVARIQNALK
jgi:hypothetical protein